MQDSTGNWGGSLILSTTIAGSTSSSSGQPVDRLTIDSSGLATFTGGITLSSTSSTLTAAGSTVLGTTGSQTLTVNAVTTFASTAPITANANVVLGASNSQTLQVNAVTTFASGAAITANAAVTVTAGNAFNALGNSVLGSSGSSNTITAASGSTFSALGNTVLGTSGGSNTLAVYASTTFSSAIIANAAVTVNAAATVSGLTTLSGGAALISPVTVNGVTLAKVATTANYTQLVAQPRIYAGSTSYSTVASGAPTQPANISCWHGTISVSGNNGLAIAYPTSTGTSAGKALFSSILSVSSNVLGTSAWSYLSSISSDLTTVTIAATSALAVASSGTSIMVTVVGTYSS